jgi:hypothetical protein
MQQKQEGDGHSGHDTNATATSLLLCTVHILTKASYVSKWMINGSCPAYAIRLCNV